MRRFRPQNFRIALWTWTTKANIEMSCFSNYTPLITPLLKRDAKFAFFLTKSCGYKHQISKTTQAKRLWVRFSILYHTNHPLGKEGPWNLRFFNKKWGLQAQNIEISSGTTQAKRLWDRFSIYTTQTAPLGKEDSEICMGINAEKTAPSSQNLLQ